MTKRIIFTLFTLLIISSCVSSAPTVESPPIASAVPETESINWWKDAVFYEIFVRSFYDSDGDGIGDFNGITAKLDYLNDGDPNSTTDLGITGIWLMPIFPSPSYHGYDVIDYYNVNSQYGSMDDFKRLLNEAHKRDISVVIDLVINHTSGENAWFKSAKRDVNSPYRNWYLWSKTNPDYKGPWGQTVWHSSTSGFYYGIFEPFMPDLNYNNPEVTAEMRKIYSFWLKDVGVDGFRLDAAKHLIEEDIVQQNTDTTHQWYQEMYPVYKDMNPNAMVVGELFGDGMTIASRYVRDEEFDLIFNFQLASEIIKSAQSGRANYSMRMIETSNKFLPQFQYAPFLSNHDQNRILSQLNGNVNKAKIAAALMLTAPGTPFIYYGEEIGMVGNKPDENIRLPMQWNAEFNAGFTTGKPWRALNTNFDEINVATETDDPNSLLSLYRDLVQLRAKHPSLRTGQYITVDCNNPAVYAVLRVDESEILLVLINLDEEPLTDYILSVKDAGLADQTYRAQILFGENQAQGPTVMRGGFDGYRPVNELKPYDIFVIKINP